MRFSALVLCCALLGAGCSSTPEPELLADTATSQAPPTAVPAAATPVPAPTSAPAPTPTPTGPRTCVLEIPTHDGTPPYTNIVTEVSFETPANRYDELCRWSDNDVDREPGTISVQFDETSLAGWFSHLLWGDLRDVVVNDAKFVQVEDRAAWAVDVEHPAETADSRGGRLQRHFILDLGWQTMRLVAELPASENPASATIRDEIDAMAASIDFVANPDGDSWGPLPLRGQTCPVGAFWEFDTPADWFSYSDCRYFDTSSETDHAMQCECFPPLTTHSTATAFADVGTELLDVTVEERVTANGLAVRVLDGTTPENEVVGEREVRMVVVDLIAERMVLMGTRFPDHAGPGHSWETTIEAQDAVVDSLRATRPLEPLVDVPVCAAPDTPRPVIDLSDPYRPYGRTGDYDGDGFLDTLTFVDEYGDYGEEVDRPTATLWYQLGNGGEVIADAASMWPDYERIGQSAVRDIVGLDGAALTLVASDPTGGWFLIAHLQDCEIATIAAWPRAAGHCYATTDDGDLLRLYGTAASIHGDLDDGHYEWDGVAFAPIEPAPEEPLCGPDFGEGA